jgi:uncharacterized protein
MAESVDVVNAAYSSFAKGDIPTLLESVSEDTDWSSPGALPHGGDFSGKDGVLQFFQGIGAKWDSLTIDVESVADAGDGLVLTVIQATGTRKGGGTSGYGAAHAFNVRDGKIVRWREFVDLDAPLGG